MKEIQKIKIGSRGSPLAVHQVGEVSALLVAKGIHLEIEHRIYTTIGDKDKKISLTDAAVTDDFFTDALDQALCDGEIDVAIHSAKDMPQDMRKELSILALTKSIDETDAFVGKVKFADLKSGATVGTSSVIRQEEIKRLNPQLKPVDVRGTIDERIALVEKGECDGIIIATVALKRLGLEKHIKDIMPWESSPLQGQLAVVGCCENAELARLFATIDIRRDYGQIYLVGAGPGDPELITIKGLKILQKVDCILYDYLVDKTLLDYAPNAEKIYVGKKKGEHMMPQAAISRLLRLKAMKGKSVAHLKGGDPFIFGRGPEELEYLRAYHMDVIVIPGLSSATAIASLSEIPLTARGISSSVAFLSGHEKGETLAQPIPIKIPEVDTVVFLMGLTKLNLIIKAFKDAGWEKITPVAIVSRGTYKDEDILISTLENIQDAVKKHKTEPPALIIVGNTVKFWKKSKVVSNNLFTCRKAHNTFLPSTKIASYREAIFSDIEQQKGYILYTGTNPEKFKFFGQIIHFPMIEISEVVFEPYKIQVLIEKLSDYVMIILTSRFAVKYFCEMLRKHNYVLSDLRGKDIVVVGKDTEQALKGYGLEASLVGSSGTSKGLFEEMREKYDLDGKKVFFPRSSLPNPYLKEELQKLGSIVDELTIYQNTKPQHRQLPGEGINRILFTSPSTVKNFLDDYGNIPDGWTVLSKGSHTSQYLKDEGYDSEIINAE